MKFIKWLVIGLITLVVVGAIAIAVVLSTLDLNEYRDDIQAEAKKATGRDLTIGGPIDLAVSLTPALVLSDVSFANMPDGSRPEMVSLKRLEVEVDLMPLLQKQIKVNRIILLEPDILLETNAEGKPNWELEGLAGGAAAEPSAAGDGSPPLPAIGKIIIKDARLTYRDGVTGQEQRIELQNFEGSAASPDSPLSLALAGSYQGEAFEAEGELGAPALLLAGNQPYPLQLQAKAGGADIAVDGQIVGLKETPTPDLTITVEGESLANLSGLAGAPLPPLGPYSLTSKVKATPETVQLTGLQAKIGGSDLAGDATLALGGARPAITANLSSSLLDLADFTKGGETASEEAAAEAPADDSPYVIPDTPLPLDGLKAADADLKVAIASLRPQPGMEITDVDVTLALKNGALSLKPVLAKMYDGAIEANVDLDGGKEVPSLVTKVDIKGLDYGKLLKDQELTTDVEGTLDVDLDLTSVGGSPRSLASNLNGTTEIVGNKGVITNRLLKLISSALASILEPLMSGEKDVPLNCIVSRFDVKNGLMTSNALLFDSDIFTLNGGGTVNLGSEELELAFDTATRQASLLSLAVPFNVGGTFKSPTVVPDPLGTALSAAKVAGTVANPLAALGVVVGGAVAEEVTGGEENPCVAALDGTAAPAAAPQGSAEPAPASEPAAVEQQAEEAVKNVEETLKEGLKGLFGGD